MPDFDAVATVGGWCRVTAQARRFFGYNTAYPFDWLITPTPALTALLDEDFEQFLRPETLRLRGDLDGVTCTHYGVQHKHDFLRNDAHQTLPNWAEQMEAVWSKYAHRRRNFDSLGRAGRVLFIRHDDMHAFTSHNEGDDFSGHPATQADAERLLGQLRARFPHSEVTLLCVDFDAPNSVSPGLILDSAEDFGDATPGDYRGSDRGWNELFARHDLRLAVSTAPVAEAAEVSEVGEGYW